MEIGITSPYCLQCVTTVATTLIASRAQTLICVSGGPTMPGVTGEEGEYNKIVS